MAVHPYLFMEGRAEEAVQFYSSALGAEVEDLVRFKDSPDPDSCAPADGNKIMHASLKVYGARIMLSDGYCGANGPAKFIGFAVAITPPNEASGKKVFDALAAGGNVQAPLSKTFWSPCFGMLTDKFGVQWKISVPLQQPPAKA